MMVKTKIYCYLMFGALSSSSKMMTNAFVTSARNKVTTATAYRLQQQQRQLQIRHVTLPPRDRRFDNTNTRLHTSVTGTIYTASKSEDEVSPTIVKLFTKEGCTLCDKVTEVLKSVQDQEPHTLQAVDITDPEHEVWWSKYKYDIPVLHLNDQYWIKHRLDVTEAIDGLRQAREGTFVEQQGDPDAGAMEAKQAERESQNNNN
mmetsp:Transcript_3285/g.4741  ORF Transcript_3285/g.4741 Transcript_3285/m.4741 type:complete len:203 (-) Transcript_3285:91-699(-)